MDFSELVDKYKELPVAARMGLAAILAILPAVYFYISDGEILESELESAKRIEQMSRKKFEKARRDKANLPKLQEQYAFTEEQLKKAKEQLPDTIRIEEFLQKTATIAREVGVELISFDPQDLRPGRGDFKYMEVPVQTMIEGRFAQVAGFYDRIVHLESSVFVRNLDLQGRLPTDFRLTVAETRPAGFTNQFGAPANNVGTEAQSLDPDRLAFENAKNARQNIRVRAGFDIVIFRAMTAAEEAQHAAPAALENPESKDDA